MIYELRIYEAMPGKMGALHDRFADHTVGLFKEHGFGLGGFWTEEIGTTNQLTYLVSFPDMADRDKKYASFSSDPRWLEARARSEANGTLVARIHNNIMQLTDYSPQPRFDFDVVDLRTYEATPGKLPALHQRFANHSHELLKKHGMEPLGYWTEVVGTSNRLIWMLGYPSMAAREQSWATYRPDPAWHKVRDESEKDGVLVTRAHIIAMRPTPYSPR
jgi:hypothetical protein